MNSKLPTQFDPVDVRDAVFAYSVWLDAAQGLMVPGPGEARSHEALVDQFFAERDSG